jgi:predicted dinucleotide-binding enzyme
MALTRKSAGLRVTLPVSVDAKHVLRRDGSCQQARANSIGITSAKYLAGARIVRAFNTMSFRKLADNANRPGARMAIPIAGDDKEALAVARTLIRDAGFDSVVIGPLESAKLFGQGGPLYGQELTAEEMQQRLKPAVNFRQRSSERLSQRQILPGTFSTKTVAGW